MRTEHVDYLLPDYLTSRLEEPLRSGVKAHLVECAACRASMEILREGFDELAVQKTPHLPESYFLTVLPRVRQRLEKKGERSLFAHPLVARFAMPLAAGVLALLLLFHVPFPAGTSKSEHSSLQPMLQGVGGEDLIDIVLDEVHRQALHTVGEGETSSVLAESLLRGDRLLSDVEHFPSMDEMVLGRGGQVNLEQLSDREIERLVARLGERTIL